MLGGILALLEVTLWDERDSTPLSGIPHYALMNITEQRPEDGQCGKSRKVF